MTRTGVNYVAMTAAAICAGALGYAVIWSHGEPERPPAAMSTPRGVALQQNQEIHAPASPADTPVMVQHPTDVVPPIPASPLSVPSNQEPVQTASAPDGPPRTPEATLPPPP